MLVILAVGLWLGYRVNLARHQRLGWRPSRRMAAGSTMPTSSRWVRSSFRRATRSGSRAGGRLRRGNTRWLRRGSGVRSAMSISERSRTSACSWTSRRAGQKANNVVRPVDDLVKLLRTQSGIKTLHLDGIKLTDKGLESVADLTNLRELILGWAREISDAGVVHLGRLAASRCWTSASPGSPTRACVPWPCSPSWKSWASREIHGQEPALPVAGGSPQVAQATRRRVRIRR